MVADDFDLERVGARDGAGLEDSPHGGHRDGRQNQRGNDRPDDLDRGVAVDLRRLGIAGLAPETEDGIHQRPLHQDEDEDRPIERGVQEVVADPGEVAAREQRGLRIVVRSATGQHER